MLRETNSKTIILFLGNPIFSDDKVGLLIGEELKSKLESLGFKVEVLERTGFNIIDYIEGFDTAIIVDSIKTGRYRPGEVVVFKVEDFKPTAPTTPHYSGIPEAIELMKALGLKCPIRTYVIAVEVEDPYTISENLTPPLEKVLERVKMRVYEEILRLLRS